MSARSLADFEPLGPAEHVLIDRLQSGMFDLLDGGEGSEGGDRRRVVRADLLRLLILGGRGAPFVHEKGVRLAGALVTGTLDLEGCRVPRDIGLVDCEFEGPLVLRSAVIDTLFLDGTRLPAILADRLEARGDLFLRHTAVDGPVLIRGGRLGGGLVADGAAFSHPGSLALDAAGLDVRGDITLRGAAVRGGISVAGARLAADLDASGALIEEPDGIAIDAASAEIFGDVLLRHAAVSGESRFAGARCAGAFDISNATLSAPGELALGLAGGSVGGAFRLREGARVKGLIDLRGATIGMIVDDPECWPGPADLALNRCLYGAIMIGPVDAATRLRWLSLQAPGRWGEDFWPQPYEHLASVLSEMGHNEDARHVLFEKERLQRRARRERARSRLLRATLWLRDLFLRVTVGYGQRSLLVLVWLAVLWISGAGVLAHAWHAEAMRPNMPFILRSPEWIQCGVAEGATIRVPSLREDREGLAAPGQSQLGCYLAQPEGATYPAFNPWMYAVDTLLPAVETGQRGFWAPDTRTPTGAFAKGVVYMLKLLGWLLSLLAVAGFSGLVRSR